MNRLIKRIFDLVISGFALILLSPLFLLLMFLVRMNLGAPVFFVQIRPGLHGKPFLMYKFRTMMSALDLSGKPLPDAERLTRFGRFLRSSSLDELPELWNVFRGDMSLVGPRPLLMEYLPLYSIEQAKRHDVLPGITGWAQINGRNAISWDQKFALDVWYVERANLMLDIKILLLTIKKVLIKEGISEAGSATMTPFQGQSPNHSNMLGNHNQDQELNG